MKIAFVGCRGVPALYGGFETAVTEIGARLVERGHDVTVYCRKGYGDEENSTNRGMRKRFVPRIKLRTVETISHTLVSLLHLFVNPPDVIVLVNPANGPLLWIPLLRGTPFAINVDGLDWERAKWPWIGRKYIYFAAWCCTKLAPQIIADSRGMQDFYKRQWNRETYYASYGTDVISTPAPDGLEQLGLAPREYFLVVARLAPENNTHLIIDAFRGVDTDKKLVIIGDDRYNSPYKRRLEAVDDERVTFLGSIYNQPLLRQLMCHSYAYVHGHSVGGTNPVLLKALGCGACVLYLDVNFNAEVVDGAGIPFPGSVEGARAVLQEVASNPAKADAYRPRGPERIRETYTWERATDQYEDLCYRLCCGSEVVSSVPK